MSQGVANLVVRVVQPLESVASPAGHPYRQVIVEH